MQYRVLQKSFLGGRIVEEGEVIEFDGEAHESNLEPVKDKPKTKRQQSAADIDPDPAD